MNRSHRILPVYTGDVSGVCSALYELGGMVVIHDPSGCNSTYNTHDETRWYDMESLIFITGLKESDAVMGNDDKLVADVIDAAMALKPAFIALTNSPIPYINGTDFKALAKIIEEKTAIPTFYVKANGMHDYSYGASLAFEALARKLLVKDGQSRSASEDHLRLNLLGVTPLDFWDMETVDALKAKLVEMGFEINSCWAMGDTLENCLKAADADVNLVVSSTGLRLARYLKEIYGTPYVAGIPVGTYADVLKNEILAACNLMPARAGANADTATLESVSVTISAISKADIATKSDSAATSACYTVGEPVTMGSLAAALTIATGRNYQLLCPIEAGRDKDARPFGADIICHQITGEEGAEAFLKDAEYVTADPFYRHVCGADVSFDDLPDLAFSGRCFRKNVKNIMELY